MRINETALVAVLATTVVVGTSLAVLVSVSSTVVTVVQSAPVWPESAPDPESVAAPTETPPSGEVLDTIGDEPPRTGPTTTPSEPAVSTDDVLIALRDPTPDVTADEPGQPGEQGEQAADQPPPANPLASPTPAPTPTPSGPKGGGPGLKPHVPGTGPTTDAVEPPDNTPLTEESPDNQPAGQPESTDVVTAEPLGGTSGPEAGGDSEAAPAS